jgi:uncharacterized protein YcbK (DUF882 family)
MNSRRWFLGASAGLVIAPFMAPSLALASDFWTQPRRLWLRRQVAPGRIEEFKGVYFADGHILWPEYVQVCQLLRDVRANQAVQMSPVLLDILAGVQGVLVARGSPEEPFIATSGYRTHATNQSTEGAALRGFHPKGEAVDGHPQSYGTADVAKAARYLRGGGVGVYPSRGFCHIDTGAVRTWRG